MVVNIFAPEIEKKLSNNIRILLLTCSIKDIKHTCLPINFNLFSVTIFNCWVIFMYEMVLCELKKIMLIFPFGYKINNRRIIV